MTFILIALTSVGGLMVDVCARNDPDPFALLQGVQSARLQIPPSSLAVREIRRDPLMTTETLFAAEFEGDRWGFEGEDITNSFWSTVFDGTKAIIYEQRLQNVEYRNLASPRSVTLFDPRTLGLTYAYSWYDTLKILPEETTNFRFELVGREEMNGQLAWHVRIQFVGTNSWAEDYWIDDLHGFRVYRRDLNGVRTFSYYENSNYLWLPSRVVSKAYNRLHPREDEMPQWEREVQVLQAKADVRFPKGRWGLAGMKLMPGTVVIAHDPPEIVGTWDGRRMVPEFEDRSRPPLWSYVVMVLVVSGPAILVLWLRKTRRFKAGT